MQDVYSCSFYIHLMERLKSSFRKFYGRYRDLIQQYEVSLSWMFNEILTLDQLQWPPNQSDFSPIRWTWYQAWPSPNYELCPQSICNGCGMSTVNAYSSGRLVLSHLRFAYVLLLRPLTLNHTLHQFITLFPDLTFTEWGICQGFCMPTGGAYPCRHMVPSLLGTAYAPIVETSFLELAVSFLEFSPWIFLGIFSILLDGCCMVNFLYIHRVYTCTQ